jgi:hypothetical protein
VQGFARGNAPNNKRNDTDSGDITDFIAEQIDLMHDNVFMERLGVLDPDYGSQHPGGIFHCNTGRMTRESSKFPENICGCSNHGGMA